MGDNAKGPFFFPLLHTSLSSSFLYIQQMATTHHSLNEHSFDLGIENDSQDLSLIIVEESLDKDEKIDTGEVVSSYHDEVNTKKIELSDGNED